MKIVLSGVSTINKGAELMLYAILQEIECRFPEAEVFLPVNSINHGLKYIDTPLRLKYKPIEKFIKVIRKCHLNGILRVLHLPEFLDDVYAIKDADYFLDSSGLLFSDQQKSLSAQLYKWEHLLRAQKAQGTKIVFLPQAFGPIEKSCTKKVLASLNKYADLILPRENVSYQYLKGSGILDMSKVHQFTDFTSLVEGKIPHQYTHLKGCVCIIPNERMISKGAISMDAYLKLLKTIIKEVQKKQKSVYLLNHEGKKDENIAYRISNALGGEIEVVTNLNALETKGIISTAYVVVSSRFHGVASALNSCVPCLATSWNHKYKELFNDYEMQEGVMPLDDTDKALDLVRNYLDESKNHHIRMLLEKNVPKIKAETQEMWRMVWG